MPFPSGLFLYVDDSNKPGKNAGQPGLPISLIDQQGYLAGTHDNPIHTITDIGSVEEILIGTLVVDQGTPADVSLAWPVNVVNTLSASVNFPPAINVIGAVAITGSPLNATINLPPVLQVGGMVGISGNPQIVAGPLPGATYPVTGLVTISGTPSVNVANLPIGSTLASGSIPVVLPNNILTAFGALAIAPYSPQTGWRFDYGINTRIVTSGTANGGQISQSNSQANLSTGTNASGNATIQTIKRVRYTPGIGGLARFTAVFTQGVANNKQYIGVGDTQDGLFFGYNGTSFGTLYRQNSVDTWTPMSSWNTIVNGPLGFDPTKGNVYEIQYQWLGYGYIQFFILDPNTISNGYVAVHVIKYPNQNTTPSLFNPTLPIYATVANSGNTSNIVLKTPSSTGGIQGITDSPSHPLDIFNTANSVVNFNDQNNNNILTISNMATFNGLTNRIPIEIQEVILSRSNAGSINQLATIYKNAIFASGLGYLNIDTSNSPVQYSTSATTITGIASNGFKVRVVNLTANSPTQIFEFGGEELHLEPGDTLTMATQDSSSAATDSYASALWKEEF